MKRGTITYSVKSVVLKVILLRSIVFCFEIMEDQLKIGLEFICYNKLQRLIEASKTPCSLA